MIEFNNGISYGLNIVIIFGGHKLPISIDGEIDECKNVQKNEIKKNNSDTINKIILNLIIFITFNVWNPWNVLSRIKSRHHWYDVNISVIKLNIFSNVNFEFNLIILIINRFIILNEIINGHGLFVVMWNGLFLFIFIIY